MYPTHAVSTTTTIKSSLHKIHSCAYCTYANQAYYSQLRMLLSDNQKTIRRWASTKCTPVYITHQMNAQRARLRPAYYSLATAGGANKIHSSTWVLSDTNRLATVQPHSAVHEQTASLQPHPKGLPILSDEILVVLVGGRLYALALAHGVRQKFAHFGVAAGAAGRGMDAAEVERLDASGQRRCEAAATA